VDRGGIITLSVLLSIADEAHALSLNPWMGDFVWSLTRFS
jgi:hypothetical protein